jgi:signal peptidase I
MEFSTLAPPQAVPPQPGLAALKSLALPGLGQWHNGEVNKAAWWFLAFAFVSVPAVALVALYLPAAWTTPALALDTLLGLGLWLGSALDAWWVARQAARQSDRLAATLDGLAPRATAPIWRMGGVTLLLLVLCDFIALPLLIGAVRTHQVQSFRIPSASMGPTLWPGDIVFADMRYACVGCRAPVQRGDVVILAYPNDRTVLYVKRVVALPGDRVQVDRGAVRVNGAALAAVQGDAPPAAAQPIAPPPPPLAAMPADPALPQDFTVAPGQVFALGDDRARSVDSRHFGTVPLQDVVGRVRQVWFSWGEGGVRWARVGRLIE